MGHVDTTRRASERPNKVLGRAFHGKLLRMFQRQNGVFIAVLLSQGKSGACVKRWVSWHNGQVKKSRFMIYQNGNDIGGLFIVHK